MYALAAWSPLVTSPVVGLVKTSSDAVFPYSRPAPPLPARSTAGVVVPALSSPGVSGLSYVEPVVFVLSEF